MPTPKPPCVSVFPWLRENLGKNCLGVLTGQDYKALRAAMQIFELYQYTDDRAAALEAFGLVVKQMQPTARRLAFHGIAHLGNWEERETVWERAGLPRLENPGLCAYEPGGAKR